MISRSFFNLLSALLVLCFVSLAKSVDEELNAINKLVMRNPDPDNWTRNTGKVDLRKK